MDKANNRKKKICVVMILLFSLCFAYTAHAFQYQGDGLVMDIPDGSGTYYYTPNGTNMTGEMLSAAQEENPLALIGSYADNILSYSLKIVREETVSAEDGEASPVQAKAAAIRESLAEEYAFSEDAEETVAGKQAAAVSGDSLKNPDYGTKISVLEDSGYVYTVTIIYRKSEDGQALAAAETQLGTLRLGADAVPTVAPTATPSPTVTPSPKVEPSPEPTQEVTASMAPLETKAPEQNEDAFAPDTVLQSPLFLPLLIGLAVVVLLVILLAVRHRKNKGGARTEEPGYGGRVGRSGKPLPVMREQEAEVQEPPLQLQLPPVQEKEEFVPPEESLPGHGRRIEAVESREYVTPLPPEQSLEELCSGSRKKVVEIYDAEAELIRGFDLKAKGDYVFAAREFHECAKHTADKTIGKTADMQTVECLTLAKEYDAALVLAVKVFYKDHEYSLEEREKLKSMIVILKKTSRRK